MSWNNEFTNNTLLNYLDENDFNNKFYNISDSSDNNFYDKRNEIESPIRNNKSFQRKSDSTNKINSQNNNKYKKKILVQIPIRILLSVKIMKSIIL